MKNEITSVELNDKQWEAVIFALQKLRVMHRDSEDGDWLLDIIWKIRESIFTEDELKDVSDIRATANRQ